MSITTGHAINMASQYNETDISEFLINVSVGSRRFLTEAEQTRILRATEVSALYYASNNSGFGTSARYRWYSSGGTLLNEYYLSLTSAGVHNSIPIDWTSFYVPEGATRLTVAIVNGAEGFANGDFSLGSGDLFTSWTLTQPSRTNLALRSQEFDNGSWSKLNTGTASLPVVTANNVVAPDGTMTADRVVFNSGAGVTISDRSTLIQTIAQSAGNPYSGAIYLRGNVGGEQIVFRHAGNSAYTLITLTTSWVRYRQIETAVGANANFEFGIRQGFVGTINSSATIYAWGAQFEAGAYTTPYIPTTNASVTTSLGEFLQDATGGVDGGRALKMWVSTGSTDLQQSVSLVNGVNYTIRFWAKVDALYGNDYLTSADATLLLSTDWTLYTQTFTQIGTGSFAQIFDYTNDADFGFVYLDKVSITPTNPSELSETRTFLLDDSCVAYEYQLNWLNKLGGHDTWVMTGFPTEVVEVKRSGEIEYSRRTNYTSPNRIYANRANESRKSITLSHQCKDRATAEWLKSELIDSIDVLLLIDGVYYPVDVVPSSIVVRNTFSQDYTIRVTFRYGFDINVQTR